MYIQVKLLNGFQKSLTYKVPQGWDHTKLADAIVTVPLQKRTELAYVIEVSNTLPHDLRAAQIKDAASCNALPDDPGYQTFIKHLSYYYQVNQLHFFKRLTAMLEQREEEDIVLPELPHTVTQAPELTPAQQNALSELQALCAQPGHHVGVLHGVTGSGKTELYKQLISQQLAHKKSVLFLVPEVSLATQFTRIFKQYFDGKAHVIGFHSATPRAEKKKLWQLLYTQENYIIIGVHLPVLLPLPKLGLIIIDEEHDAGYQEKKIPRINTKEAALMKAHAANIPVILGSATPACTTLYNVEHKNWKLVSLTERFKGNFAHIELEILDKDAKKRPHFWISNKLHDAIAERLANKEQAIIFLNRRGYSFFLQCLQCTHVFECTNCSVSLTLHENNSLICHYCGFTQSVPEKCPVFKEPEKQFLKKGIGTQQLVTILQKLFPQARIARADLDSTVDKKKWQKIVDGMLNRELDILIGTQTVTKGYHFPHVTLVGVVWADGNLNFPFYTATETTLQQLLQVAGRAGRETQNGQVIIQALRKHPVFEYLDERKYREFYQQESAKRQEVSYPPWIRLAELEFRHEAEHTVIQDALACANACENFIDEHKLNVTLLGPAKPLVHKVNNISIQKLYLKSDRLQDIIRVYQFAAQLNMYSSILFTPQPLS